MKIQWNLLLEHFDVRDVEFKPQTFSKDNTKALAVAFVDPRRYQERLDAVVGIPNWSVEYRAIGETCTFEKVTQNGTPQMQIRAACVARISIYDSETNRTIVREEVGEFDGADVAQYPTASAQAFKRACVTLGLGRYLYDFPQTWVMIENRRIIDVEVNRLRAMLAKINNISTSAEPDVQTRLKTQTRVVELAAECTNAGLKIDHDLASLKAHEMSYEELVTFGKYLKGLLG